MYVYCNAQKEKKTGKKDREKKRERKKSSAPHTRYTQKRSWKKNHRIYTISSARYISCCNSYTFVRQCFLANVSLRHSNSLTSSNLFIIFHFFFIFFLLFFFEEEKSSCMLLLLSIKGRKVIWMMLLLSLMLLRLLFLLLLHGCSSLLLSTLSHDIYSSVQQKR